MVSLDHLKSKLSRAQFLIVPRRKVVAYEFKITSIWRIFLVISMIFYNLFEIIKFQNFFRNLCNKIIVQSFKNTARIDLHFKVRKILYNKKN